MLNKYFNVSDWADKLNILRCIAYGLALIHKEGLIHKDLHSGNIVCTSLSSYYITSFRLCRPIGVQGSKIFGYTLDYKNSRSGFYKQVKAIEESKKKFPTYEPNKMTAIHSMAIYTSHLLDFENLPEPIQNY
ncbi:8053_t:CDS:2 [Entrophospora sp. SA101]|nr:8053_t:CDS:2 [Entrophospora sp. SA101]